MAMSTAKSLGFSKIPPSTPCRRSPPGRRAMDNQVIVATAAACTHSRRRNWPMFWTTIATSNATNTALENCSNTTEKIRPAKRQRGCQA